MQNNTDALKRAIIEGMNAMLAAIDNVGTATPQSKPKQRNKKETPKEKSTPVQAPEPVKKSRKKKSGCYRVEDLRALYCLADAGLLHHIKGTAASTNYPGSYVYLIDRNADTKAALAVFLTQEEIAADV